MTTITHNKRGFTPTPTFMRSVVKKYRALLLNRFGKMPLCAGGRERSSQHERWCRGFTLVETLVAITVLLVAIVGPMSIAAKGLQASFYAREQATALYLAQEAIESIHSLKNNNALEEIGSYADGQRDFLFCQADISIDGVVCAGLFDTWQWYDTLDASCKTSFPLGSGCGYDGVFETHDTCGNLKNCILQFDKDATDGLYYHHQNADGPSQFTRKLYVEEEEVDREAAVTVEVSWQSTLYKADTVSVVLQTRIFNPYE